MLEQQQPESPERMSMSDEGSRDSTDADWFVVRTLGEGAYGEVKLVTNKTYTSCFAMKCIKKECQSGIEHLKKEDMLHRMVLGHPNVVHCFGMRSDQVEVQLFLEYCDGGELFDQIEPDVGMEEFRAHIYFRDLISGIKYCHEKGVAHRDIKPENLLLTRTNVLKISDFGLATLFKNKNGHERMLETRCGTLPYVAPEVFDESIPRYKGPPNDIWSAGVVLVAMLVGELPWDEPNRNFGVYAKFMDDHHENDDPWRRLPKQTRGLVRKILTEDPADRATIRDIEHDDWFVNFKPHMRVRDDDRKENILDVSMKSVDSNVSTASSTSSSDGPSAKRRKCIPSSQPTSRSESNEEFKVAAKAMLGFSQPADIRELLLSGSQSSPTQPDNLQHLVRRMTRFCVNVALDKAVEQIEKAVESSGFECRKLICNQMEVSRKDLTFIVTIHSVNEKVLIDCRRSKGDGLQFKRNFLDIRRVLTPIICKSSTSWLEKHV